MHPSMGRQAVRGEPLVDQGVLEAIVHPSGEQRVDRVGPLVVQEVLHPLEGRQVVRVEMLVGQEVLHPLEEQQVVRGEMLVGRAEPRVDQGVKPEGHWAGGRVLLQRHRVVERKRADLPRRADREELLPLEGQQVAPGGKRVDREASIEGLQLEEPRVLEPVQWPQLRMRQQRFQVPLPVMMPTHH